MTISMNHLNPPVHRFVAAIQTVSLTVSVLWEIALR